MKLAILLPVKNRAETINRAIDSVVNQTIFKNNLFDYEIVLVDNCSEDNLLEKIKGYKNIKYLFCSSPGIVPALNTGLYYILSKPEFEYVARIDGDDEWNKLKIEKQINFLLQNKDIDICGTQMEFIPEEQSTTIPFKFTQYPLEDNEIKKFILFGGNPFGHPSIIYKKEIFLKFGGYDETYKFAEDLDLWVKCLKYFKFANLPEVLVKYSFGNKDKTYQKIQSQSAKFILNKTIDFYTYYANI